MTTNGHGGTAPEARSPEDIADGRAGQPPARLPLGLLALAAGVRMIGIEAPSLWYDELVSYRVATAPTPTSALALLREIDATRAPLHPLLLNGWLRVAGDSVPAGRAFSAVCGVALVAAVFALGRRLLDARSAWWAAALAAFSPPLVHYARELRMYALLALLAALAWLVAGSAVRWDGRRSLAYVALLVALGYTHPLGGLMIAALAVFTAIDRPTNGLTRLRWLGVHALAAALLLPALRDYATGAPTYDEPSGRDPRLLLGFPIGFVGGNFLVLAACVAIIAFGLISRPRRPRAAALLLTWLLGPVLLLYAASWVGRPLFGPARYTLFVAPAYLLLLGQGLARLTRLAAVGAGLGVAACMAQGLAATVYADGLKADWRAAAALIRSVDGSDAAPEVAIAVVDRRYVGELEVARHYLGGRATVRVAEPPWPDERGGWLAVGLRDGRPAAALPLDVAVPTPVVEVHRVPGLLLMRAVGR
jgi:hypothetical protein